MHACQFVNGSLWLKVVSRANACRAALTFTARTSQRRRQHIKAPPGEQVTQLWTERHQRLRSSPEKKWKNGDLELLL